MNCARDPAPGIWPDCSRAQAPSQEPYRIADAPDALCWSSARLRLAALVETKDGPPLGRQTHRLHHIVDRTGVEPLVAIKHLGMWDGLPPLLRVLACCLSCGLICGLRCSSSLSGLTDLGLPDVRRRPTRPRPPGLALVTTQSDPQARTASLSWMAPCAASSDRADRGGRSSLQD